MCYQFDKVSIFPLKIAFLLILGNWLGIFCTVAATAKSYARIEMQKYPEGGGGGGGECYTLDVQGKGRAWGGRE